MVGLFQETGPCEVVELGKGQYGTIARDWGWDRSSNVLYIDQPNEVGFSFDVLTNGTINFIKSQIDVPPQGVPPGSPGYTFLNGTFSSNSPKATSNTTAIAAQAIWHMLQGFLTAFPQYNPGNYPNSNKTGAVGINLFAESYGGKYGPIFASFWKLQNLRRRNGTIPFNTTFDITLTSLGIFNGCVDDLVQAIYYPAMASNNSYGIQAVSPAEANAMTSSFYMTSGCKDMINQCRNLAASADPHSFGENTNVSSLCASAQQTCQDDLLNPYLASSRSIYDITHPLHDPFPVLTYLSYLNTASFQSAIGVSLNYTEDSQAVTTAFTQTGDYELVTPIQDLVALLASGVRVALIYGDADFICNWLGGEALSLAIARTAPAPYPSLFPSAGYADVLVNDTYTGGAVRQAGNLSFARVYDAGHLVPAYQPETAFTLFTRIIEGTSLASGQLINSSTFVTSGDPQAYHQNKPPAMPKATCYLRAVQQTCEDDQKVMLQNGQGFVINDVLYTSSNGWAPPSAEVTKSVGTPGMAPTVTGSAKAGSSSQSSIATGVYVATGAPRKKSGGGSIVSDLRFVSLCTVFAVSIAEFTCS
ncbi:MAG: hypothetical protein M1824_005996 [Vezdaea acicularis]|nr:MAG: hypothetical protein M1824_005996 [Vezdaea acicularis]